MLLITLSLALAVRTLADDRSERASATVAATRIDAFHTQLVEAMKTPAYAVRVAALTPVVAQLFDMRTVARLTLGRTWRELDAAGRDQFRGLLETLIVATYADRFDSYEGQQFSTIEAVPTSRGWVVKTELVRANGERLNLDYFFNDDAVFNVVADGVSDLSLRRADYNSILKREGFAALLGYLEDNITELHRNNAGSSQ